MAAYLVYNARMQPLPLTPGAQRLVHRLAAPSSHPAPSGQPFHVSGLGSHFYFVYEQLRKVAEYREDHLLLRSAIERFIGRQANLAKYQPIGSELIRELTQAGYLQNDSIAEGTIAEIDALLASHAMRFQKFHKLGRVDPGIAAEWFLQVASVQIENLLAPDPKATAFAQFAYEHYLTAIDADHLRDDDPATTNDQGYRIALYCAVQRALLKSDKATTRAYTVMASLPDLEVAPLEHFAEVNELVDTLFQAPSTNRLFRLINRYGAPMRILRELIKSTNGIDELLANRDETLSHVKALCGKEYDETHTKLRSRIIKTIAFIFITKILVGVAVEVPYDIILHSEIAWLPLGINIMFPPLYMALISSRIHIPGRQNTAAITDHIDRVLYDGAGAPIVYEFKRRVASTGLNRLFTGVYTISFVGSIALVIWTLYELGYNFGGATIFFVFFSAVSFLGFRLRQSASELELVEEHQGWLQTLIDFLSTPFVRIGHWISDKYARANFITFILDLAIELPFKTLLRLIQQWVSYMRDKQEEL